MSEMLKALEKVDLLVITKPPWTKHIDGEETVLFVQSGTQKLILHLHLASWPYSAISHWGYSQSFKHSEKVINIGQKVQTLEW